MSPRWTLLTFILFAVAAVFAVSGTASTHVPLRGHLGMIHAKRVYLDDPSSPSGSRTSFTTKDFVVVNEQVHNPQYREDWCEVDLVANYTSGRLISLRELDAVQAAFSLSSQQQSEVSGAPLAGPPSSRSFLLSLRNPLLLKRGEDLLEKLETSCAGGGGAAAPHASHFGTAMVLLHATFSQLRRCVAAEAEESILPLLARVCIYHDWAKVDVDVHQAIHEELHPAPMRRRLITASTEDSSTTTDEGPGPHLLASIQVNPALGCAGLAAPPTSGASHLPGSYRVVADTASPFCSEGSTLATLELECHPPANSTCSPSAAVAYLLSRYPTTVRIERKVPITYSNKFSRGLLQTGVEFQEPFGEGLGLSGEGLVVGVSDSGIDYDHCFFRDDQHSVPINSLNTNHRKIIRYQELSANNRGDFKPGHGTHVCGSVAGSAVSGNYIDFHGVVPKAKLTFLDLSVGTGEGLGVGDLTSMFNRARSDGARIHTNSWGSGYSYTSASSTLDSYLFQNPDMLILFAAGNSADEHCISAENDLYCDRHTVLSQATSKNVLAVGASMGSYQSWKFAKLGNYILNASTLGGLLVGSDAIKAEKGNFGPEDASELSNLPVILASPIEACGGALNGGADLSGKIVFIRRGSCFFTAKIAQAQNQKAAAVVIVNNDNGDPIVMGCSDEVGDCGIHTPNFMIGKVAGEAIITFLSGGHTMNATLRSTTTVDPHKGEENLSEFSSHGPTTDLRYKPDVVAVGELVISAMSDAVITSNNCEVWASQGTSMATPLTAGLAAMLREYFMRGFHISGVEDPTRRIHNPSGMFMKAALVHAATPLTGVYDRNSRGDWRQLGKTPTFEQGHGIPRLNLSFPTSPSSLVEFFAAAVPGDANFQDTVPIGNGELVEYCIEFNGFNEEFRATLVWNDPPVSGGSVLQLVNNLDLIVNTPDLGNVYHGNMVPDQRNGSIATQEGTAGTGGDFDTVNNVEKVVVRSASKGYYHVVVRGTSVVTARLRFALVVTGREAALSNCQVACTADTCFGGNCENGVCVCREGWRGPQCNLHAFTLPRTSSSPSPTVVLEPMQWVHFALPKGIVSNVDVISTKRDGDIDLFVCDSSFMPSMVDTLSTPPSSKCSYSVITCETCGSSGPTKDIVTFPLSGKLGDGSTSQYLSLVAKCCFPAVATVMFRPPVDSSETSPVDMIELSSSSNEPTSNHALAISSSQSSRSGVTLTIVGMGFQSLTAESHQVFLRSNILRQRNTSVPPNRTPTGYVCPIQNILNATHMTCSAPTFNCNSVDEFYTVAIVEVSQSRAILAAPHPSAVSLRCSRWWEIAAVGEGEPTTMTPDQPTTTAIPVTALSVLGIRVSPSRIASKIIFPNNAVDSSQRPFQFTVVNDVSVPKSVPLAVKSTATVLPSPLNTLPAPSGLFEQTSIAPTDISGEDIRITIPASARQLAARGCPLTSTNQSASCNWVRYVFNLVQSTSEGELTVGVFTTLIAPTPVVGGVYLAVNPEVTQPPSWFQDAASTSLAIPSTSSQSTASRVQRATIPFVDVEAATVGGPSSPLASRPVFLSGAFFSDPRTSPFVAQSPQLKAALTNAELSEHWSSASSVVPAIAFVHTSSSSSNSTSRSVPCVNVTALSDFMLRCDVSLVGSPPSASPTTGFIHGEIGGTPSLYALVLYSTNGTRPASPSANSVGIVLVASGIITGVEEGTALVSGTSLVDSSDVAVFGADASLRLKGVGLPSTVSEGSDRIEVVLFPVSTSIFGSQGDGGFISLRVATFREELLVVQPRDWSQVSEGVIYRVAVFLNISAATARPSTNASLFVREGKVDLVASPIYSTFKARGMILDGCSFASYDTAPPIEDGVATAVRKSTNDQVLFMKVNGQLLDRAFTKYPSGNGYNAVIVLTPFVTDSSDTRSVLPCIVAPSSLLSPISPSTVVCIVPVEANGVYTVSVILNPTTSSPISMMRSVPRIRIYIPGGDTLDQNHQMSGGPWLVGATTTVSIESSKPEVSTPSVRIALSVAPCYTEQVEELSISTFQAILSHGRTIASINVTPMVLSPVFLCSSEREISLGQGSTTRVFSSVGNFAGPRLLLSPDAASMAPAKELSGGGKLFNIHVDFLLSNIVKNDLRLEATDEQLPSNVDNVQLFVTLLSSSESCTSVSVDPAALATSARPGTLQTINIPGVRHAMRSLQFDVERVLLTSNRLGAAEREGIRLCVAVGTPGSVPTPSSFIAMKDFALCGPSKGDTSTSYSGDSCSGHGTCSISSSECDCDSWYGGSRCQYICPMGYAKEVCSGNGECVANGVCECMHDPPRREGEVSVEWHGSACHVPVRRLTLSPLATSTFQLFRLRYSDIISEWSGPLLGRIGGDTLSKFIAQHLTWESNPDSRPILQLLLSVPSNVDELRARIHLGSSRVLSRRAALWSGSAAFSATTLTLKSSLLSELDLGISGSRTVHTSTLHNSNRWCVFTVDLASVLSAYFDLPGAYDDLGGVSALSPLRAKVEALLPKLRSSLFISFQGYSSAAGTAQPLAASVLLGVYLQPLSELQSMLSDYASTNSASSQSETSSSALTATENLALQTLYAGGYVDSAHVINITVSNKMNSVMVRLDDAVLAFSSAVISFALAYAVLHYLGLADRGLVVQALFCCCKGRVRQVYLEGEY